MLKKCPCGISFAPNNNRQKYHSRQCCDKFKRQKYVLQRKLEGKCPQCGREMDYPLVKKNFKNKRQTLSYCSKCRERFRQYHEENKEEITQE